MRLTAALFLALMFIAAVANATDAPVSIDPQDQARIQAIILKAYNDPRVIEIVNDANRNQKSVDVDLSSSSNGYELSSEASIDVPATPTAATGPSAATVEEPKNPAPKKGITHLGVMIDAGIPDGAGASIVFRPWKWLRVRADGNYNGVSGGISGGVAFLPPVFFGILPSATVEAGYYFPGNANWIARLATGNQSTDIPSLRRVSYDYVNGHLGLEFGAQNRFVFYVHGGVTYLHTTINDLQATINQSSSSGPSGTTITIKDPTVNVIAPSGKLGFLIYIW